MVSRLPVDLSCSSMNSNILNEKNILTCVDLCLHDCSVTSIWHLHSPPDSSHRDSSGNLSPTSSQPSSELQGVQRVEPRPPRGNDSWNEDDVEKEVHAPPEPGSNKDLQENLSVASADICEEKRCVEDAAGSTSSSHRCWSASIAVLASPHPFVCCLM